MSGDGEARRVLVVRADNAGDVLLAGPAVRAVAAGGDAVTLLCSPQGRPAAELLPGVHEAALPWSDAAPPPATAAFVGQLVSRLSAGRFERAVILTSFHQSSLP